jgi:hypothetical protein
MYSADHVNRLYGMVARNVTGPMKFVCFTDDAEGIRDEVTVLPLPELGCEIPPDVPGKWRKQALWGEDLFGLEGVALFIDLDSVVVDSLDPYFEYGDPDQVYVARNWVKPYLRRAQTSVFRFRIGAHSYMLKNLQADPVGISRKHQFEQNYVTVGIRGGVRFWPGTWTRHFAMHCLGPWPMRYVRRPKLPRAARIVTFPGHPKPEDAAVGRWSAKTEPRSQLDQLRYASRCWRENGTFYKHVKRYLMPTPWVQEHYQP